MGSAATALLRACHPLPTAGVTLLTVGLAVVAKLSPATAVVLVLAVFLGQLSIGWSNDAIDARRDRATGRRDKPVAAGEVSPRQVATAAGVALGLTVGLSFALGWRAAVAALTLVAAGWVYNLGLKATWASALPYAIGFGTLPAAATLAARSPQLPLVWVWIAGALLGVAAHFGNVLPDLAADAQTGVRGLPHRLGAPVSTVLVSAVLFAASLVIVATPGSGHPVPGWRWWCLLPLAGLAGVAAVVGVRRPSSPILFRFTLLVAGADLLLFGLSGGALT